MAIKFAHSGLDFDMIQAIAQRAVSEFREHGIRLSAMDVAMDVSATHANGCPLRLEALLEADKFNFAHDVLGIRQHLNRDTGKLMRQFRPRFSRPAEAPDIPEPAKASA